MDGYAGPVSGVGGTTLAGIGVATWVFGPRLQLPRSASTSARRTYAPLRNNKLRIDNRGLVAIDVADVTVQGPNAESFAVDTSCNGVQIPRASECHLFVQFKPGTAGARDATIAIRMRGVTDPYLVAVSGSQPQPRSASFPRKPSTSASWKLRGRRGPQRYVDQHWLGAMAVTHIAIEGDGDFRIVRESCKAAIAPDARCAMIFGSHRRSDRQGGQLVIKDNASGSPRVVTLSGIGHATPKLEVTPDSLAFGRQEIRGQSVSRSVRLRSAGPRPSRSGR